MHVPCGKADLVAVGAVAGGGRLGDLALGKLAGQSLVHGHGGVRSARYTHGLVHISPAGQGIADGAAQAGGSAAEGFDLGGVVMGFVFELQQPVFFLSVHLDVHLDGTGVDLVRLVQGIQQAAFFERPGADGGDIHERDRPVLAAKLFAQGLVFLKGFTHAHMGELRFADAGQKGGVAAVVGPVGIDHAQLGQRGVALFLVAEIGLAEGDIAFVHGKAVVLYHIREALFVQGDKTGEGPDHVRHLGIQLQRCGRFQGGFPRLHGVDEAAADGLHLRIGHGTAEHIHLGRAHQGTLLAGDELDALGCRVRALVELAGQVFHGQDAPITVLLRQFIQDVVQLRLGKHAAYRRAELLLA